MDTTSQEPALMAGACLDEPVVEPFLDGEIVYFSARSPQKETDNEDGLAIIPMGARRGILAVTDGLGGHAGGTQATTHALQALIKAGLDATQDEDFGDSSVRAAILNGIESANERILGMGTGSGTVLAVAEFHGHAVRPYHVGDAEILVVGRRGKVKLQTVSHSPVGYAVEAGLIDHADALHHEYRHIVSNYVGFPEMRIEVGAVLTLQRYDTLIMGSDGLFDNLHTKEVTQHIRKGSLIDAAQRLIEIGQDRMNNPVAGVPSKPDDFTFIMYRRTS